MQSLKRVGFWKDTHAMFDMSGFPDPRELVDTSVSKQAREVICAYLEAGQTYQQWMGMSYCRFECGLQLHGNLDLTDGVYVWPEDLPHYVRDHHVRLPAEFLAHLRESS